MQAHSNAMWADGNDTTFRSVVLTFSAGQNSTQLIIPTTNDTIPELSEVFYVYIADVGMAEIGATSVVAIDIAENDDPYGEVSLVNPGLVQAVRFEPRVSQESHVFV